MIRKTVYLFCILIITNFNAFSMKRSHDESELTYCGIDAFSESFEKLTLEESEETIEKIIVIRLGQILTEVHHLPKLQDLQETILLDLNNLIQTIDNLKIPILIKWIRVLRQEVLNLFDFDLPFEFIKNQVGAYFANFLNHCNLYLAQNKLGAEPIVICPQPYKPIPILDEWFL